MPNMDKIARFCCRGAATIFGRYFTIQGVGKLNAYMLFCMYLDRRKIV